LTLRRAVALAIVAAFATLTVATAATARPPSPPSTLDAEAFQPVELADSVAGDPEPLPSIDYGAPASPVPIGDFHDDAPPVEPRANPRQPVRAESVLKATPRPKPPANASHSVRGTASWYCKAGVSACHNAYPSGLYAAAGPALRVGDWRGRTVTVCGSGSCVNVRLIDWCACGSGRVIDLYSDAFSRLAPLSSGTLSVRVSW
jgi:rare lipoprotein A (peptidoglycan hydrolase)